MKMIFLNDPNSEVFLSTLLLDDVELPPYQAVSHLHLTIQSKGLEMVK